MALPSTTESDKPVFEDVILPLYSAFGQRSELSFPFIRSGVVQQGFPVFFVLVVAMLTLLNVHGYNAQIGPKLTIWVWTVCVFGLVGWYAGMFALLIKLKIVFPRLVVILPLVGFAAMSFNTVLTVFHVSLYLPEPFNFAKVTAHLPLNLAVGLIFEILFFTFVVPILERDVASKARRPKGGKRSIRVSGEEFLVSDIVLLRSQDHYVLVVTVSGRFTIRARIKDIVKQLTEDDGVMPHRSYWVAWRKIESIDMTPDYAALTMADGSIVPIAKSRNPEVEMGLNHHQITTAVT